MCSGTAQTHPTNPERHHHPCSKEPTPASNPSSQRLRRPLQTAETWWQPEDEVSPSRHHSIHAQAEPPPPLHGHRNAPNQLPLAASTGGGLPWQPTPGQPPTQPNSHSSHPVRIPHRHHFPNHRNTTQERKLGKVPTPHHSLLHSHHSHRPTKRPGAAHATAREPGPPPGSGHLPESQTCTTSQCGDNAYRPRRAGPRTTP